MKTLKLSLVLSIGILVMSCTNTIAKSDNKPLFAFDFGSGKIAKGYQQATAASKYNSELGFGFTSKGTLEEVNREGRNKLETDFVTSDEPFYFEVDLPEGNYNVTIYLGDEEGVSSTNVKAESRRLMLEKVETKEGKTVSKTFTVNIRTPKIDENSSIRLKSREFGYLNWDNKLTIEFNGEQPCVAGVEIYPVSDVPVIFLAGNSTVVDQENEPWASWGQMFPNFLEPGISVANFAESGEALKSFKGRGRLKKITSLMKPGDYLFIEFAHNDQKSNSSSYVLPWTSYTEELKYFINEARAKGGQPVLVTSMHRRRFDDDGKVINTLDEYPDAMRALAKEENLPLIDLNAMSKIMYEVWGPEHSKVAFVHYPAHSFPGQLGPLADNTHFSTYGAYELAKCVVEGIRATDLEINKFIKEGLPTFNPAEPDPFAEFDLPRSPSSSIIKPDGN